MKLSTPSAISSESLMKYYLQSPSLLANCSISTDSKYSRILMASIMCLLLLVLISSTQARPEGATNTSCYAHTITHTFFGQVLTPQDCTARTRCSDLTLTPSCPTMQDDICCRDFNGSILYTNCNYTCKFSSR